MKNFNLLLIVLVFFISCSDPENLPQDEIIEIEIPNVKVDFPSKEIDVLAQWTFKPNTGAKRLTKKKSAIKRSFKTSSNDSIDIGIRSITNPKTGDLTSSEALSLFVGNFGNSKITGDFKISYQIKFEDNDYGNAVTEDISINDTIAPGVEKEFTLSNPVDLSENGIYYIKAKTIIDGDVEENNDAFVHVVKSLKFSDECNIHSLIFNEDNTFKLYTLNEEGVCNYIILGSYILNIENNLITLYSPDSSDENNLIGRIFDVNVDENGELSGTIDIESICIQLEDSYQESNYSEELTYLPDENLEKYLINIGKDDSVDGYIKTSQASTISTITIEATDTWTPGSGGFWDFDVRFLDRISNLAGIESFPNLETLNLMGQNLDSINISKNSKLKSLSANFNTFKRLNTNDNPELEFLSIDSNEVSPILDFTNNSKIKMLSTPMCSIQGYIGQGGYYDISNMTDLELLDLYDNKLTSVDISGNPKLKEIRINWGNNISSIDFSNNTLLETILANSSGLEGNFNVSNLTELKVLNIGSNNIQTIDLSNNTKLEYLELTGNNISGPIDVSGCENLLEFFANGNSNITCIKVNQSQLDALNEVNVPEGFNWQLPIEATLTCD